MLKQLVFSFFITTLSLSLILFTINIIPMPRSLFPHHHKLAFALRQPSSPPWQRSSPLRRRWGWWLWLATELPALSSPHLGNKSCFTLLRTLSLLSLYNFSFLSSVLHWVNIWSTHDNFLSFRVIYFSLSWTLFELHDSLDNNINKKERKHPWGKAAWSLNISARENPFEEVMCFTPNWSL